MAINFIASRTQEIELQLIAFVTIAICWTINQKSGSYFET